MSLKAIVVDDEPLAREGAELMLREHDVDVVAVCADGGEAIRAIREIAADVVFLDVRMPGLSGFDVIEAIGADAMPLVVFLTAYEEHALRAFRANAADYLLKPLDEEALTRSLQRVRDRLAGALERRQSNRRWAALMQALARLGETDTEVTLRRGRIALRENRRVRYVEPDRIVRVSASGDHVTVHTEQAELLMRESMSAMQTRLAPYGFCRIHRSHIVNARRVSALEQSDAGGFSVVLDDGLSLPVSRTWKKALIEALAWPQLDD